MKNFESAFICYQKALEINPKCFLAYYNIGNYFLKISNNYDLAIEYYKKALEINSEHSDTWNNIGVAF